LEEQTDETHCRNAARKERGKGYGTETISFGESKTDHPEVEDR